MSLRQFPLPKRWFTSILYLPGLMGLTLVLLLAGCSPAPTQLPTTSALAPTHSLGTVAPSPTPSPNSATRTPFSFHDSTPVDLWTELLQRTPIPWTTPLPAPERSPLDGVYTRVDPSEPMWWVCRRCPDYLPSGGLWKLRFNRGIFSIYYPTTNWRSLGSYTVEGDRLSLFNDPYCQFEVGEYTWKLEAGALVLTLVEDTCSFNLRQANLAEAPWMSCQPPNIEAGVTGHWQVPEGCEE